MNRRNFFSALAKGIAAISVLPAAATYARHWHKTASSGVWIVNPEWRDAKYEIEFQYAHWPGTVRKLVPIFFNRRSIDSPPLLLHERVRESFPIRVAIPGGPAISPLIEYEKAFPTLV